MAHDHDHGGMDMSTEMNMGTTMDMHGGGSHHMMMMVRNRSASKAKTCFLKNDPYRLPVAVADDVLPHGHERDRAVQGVEGDG